jgi:uncharacterized protein YegL
MMVPILMSISNITLRKMDNIHHYTSAAYTTIVSFIVFGTPIVSYIPFTLVKTFELVDYFILLTTGIYVTMAMVTKAKAMQHETVGWRILSYPTSQTLFIKRTPKLHLTLRSDLSS